MLGESSRNPENTMIQEISEANTVEDSLVPCPVLLPFAVETTRPEYWKLILIRMKVPELCRGQTSQDSKLNRASSWDKARICC